MKPGPAFSRLDRLLPIGPRSTPMQTYIVYRSCLCSAGAGSQYF